LLPGVTAALENVSLSVGNDDVIGDKGLLDLPDDVLVQIISYLSSDQDRTALGLASKRLHGCVRAAEAAAGCDDLNRKSMKLDGLPTEILTTIASFLTVRDLGKLAQVNKRFRDVANADLTWKGVARDCLVTNGRSASFLEHTAPCPIWSAKERARVGHNWTSKGAYTETHLAVQDIRYMPRIQLQRSTLWVSWGKCIWSHPRRKDGSVGQTTNKVFKGHTDDVSKFVVKDGCLISGGRDRALFGWHAETGEFMFAKRYCHGSEVSAVDITKHPTSSAGGLIVTGSRDKTVKVWTLRQSHSSSDEGSGSAGSAEETEETGGGLYKGHQGHGGRRVFPRAVSTFNLSDRVWSLAADPNDGGRRVVVGTAGLMGIPSLHVIDLETSRNNCGDETTTPSWTRLGLNLKKGAGMLDVQWQSPQCFLSCGYDSCTRLWDLRVPSGSANVLTWEEPFNEAIYSLATDGQMSLLCGTARHGLVRLWDMRQCHSPVNHFYAKHPFVGQSSPVYSVAFDQRHMYAALDQSVNLLSFSGYHTVRSI